MDSNAAINSATTTESQIPSRPISLGNKITAAIWKTMVRKKDIIAEIRPLFSAVKKDDPKIAISVYVEHGGFGASAALPIASLLEELYLTDTIKRPQLVEQVKNLPYYLPRRYQDVKK